MKKIITITLTIFICKFSYGQIKIEDIKIDTTITGFHLAASYDGAGIYTPNGISDLYGSSPSAFTFSVIENGTYDSAKNVLNTILKTSID